MPDQSENRKRLDAESFHQRMNSIEVRSDSIYDAMPEMAADHLYDHDIHEERMKVYDAHIEELGDSPEAEKLKIGREFERSEFEVFVIETHASFGEDPEIRSERLRENSKSHIETALQIREMQNQGVEFDFLDDNALQKIDAIIEEHGVSMDHEMEMQNVSPDHMREQDLDLTHLDMHAQQENPSPSYQPRPKPLTVAEQIQLIFDEHDRQREIAKSLEAEIDKETGKDKEWLNDVVDGKAQFAEGLEAPAQSIDTIKQTQNEMASPDAPEKDQNDLGAEILDRARRDMCKEDIDALSLKNDEASREKLEHLDKVRNFGAKGVARLDKEIDPSLSKTRDQDRGRDMDGRN